MKYPAQSRTAAAGKATEDSKIHSSSNAKAIKYAICNKKNRIINKFTLNQLLSRQIKMIPVDIFFLSGD